MKAAENGAFARVLTMRWRFFVNSTHGMTRPPSLFIFFVFAHTLNGILNGDINRRGDMGDEGELTEAQVEFYSSKLCFLWEQYMKFLGVGIIASGATLGLLANAAAQKLVTPEISCVFSFAIVLAGIGGACFLACRWMCQIVMERQIYADPKAAKKYFDLVNTSAPSALKYEERVERYYWLNNRLKFVAAGCLLLSWGFAIWAVVAVV
ncbi:hypothetical protein AUQ42_10545 [Thalassospira sp. MCCC 1A02491]|nr:hypothetical protein AUQ42_10545 [Thalassospira sp. MCCC 1A02491]